MGADPTEPETVEAPHVDPAAPFGRKADGTPRKSAGGRPPGARTRTTPPSASSAAARPAAARRDRPPRAPRGQAGPSLRTELEVMYGFAAQMFAMRDPICGEVVMAQVPAIAEAWDKWAQTSPTVYRVLSAGMSGAGPLGVLLAHLPVLLIVSQHHGGTAEQRATFEQAQGRPDLAAATMQRAYAAEQDEPAGQAAA